MRGDLRFCPTCDSHTPTDDGICWWCGSHQEEDEDE